MRKQYAISEITTTKQNALTCTMVNQATDTANSLGAVKSANIWVFG